ncbi:MAG TPA: DNA polymerase I [Gammaproteobacteria bacterium]|nr:DNA polymerase I [Gammaproteobacteria bacterium]
MTDEQPLVLVDGSSYLYRAFHALPDLSTKSGQATGAVLGVLNMVYKLQQEYAPQHMAVVFDAPGTTFRDDLYGDYKANRAPMPDPLRSQIEPLIDAIETSGIPVLRIAGVEADDVIGTLICRAREAGLPTVVSTSDKDMAQLVDGYVKLVNTMDNTTLDAEGVRRKFGVYPAQIVDYLTLVGDTSDNVPGVKGVGAKTAAKWLAEYRSVENLAAHAEEIGGKVGESLREALSELGLYKSLVTIDCSVELPLAIEDLAVKRADEAKLKQLFEELELMTLLRRRLPDAAAATAEAQREEAEQERRYELVLTEAALDAWLDKIEAAELAAFHTETSTLDYVSCGLIGICLAVTPGEAAYIPVGHRYAGAPEQLDRDLVLGKLKAWLESDAPKLGHYLKLDTHVLEGCGIRVGGLRYDTMLESYVLGSTATRHDLDSIAAKYLGLVTVKREDVCGKGAKQIGFEQVDLESARRYAAEDADVALRIHRILWPEIERTPELGKLYVEIEQPLMPVLQAMEHKGVMVDAEMLRRQSAELAEAMASTEEAAYKAAGGPFMLGSPKQLQEVLYERLGLPVLGKTPKGQASTAESVLQELAESYELPRLVLEYRALAKLKSTYTDKLPREINPKTGRIHTCYHQAVAATGRLSSTDPNLQNIPIRTQEGRRIRQAFIAPPGYVLVAADYSQIELRIMAHLSGDARLTAAFASQQDIHRATAAEVLGLPPEAVTADQRRSAKAVNFGLIYGMSAFGLARQLGIERPDAQRYIDLYFERYPGVKAYMDHTRELAREQGYVSTVFGRRLYLPEINERNAQRRQYAERSAINAPMQGTAADIIKRAMLRIHAWLAASGADASLIMQVHDELVLEVRGSEAEAVTAEIVRLMESAADLAVPLKVDAGRGANWDQAH